jgi:1-acyl-sn-glycerol-3-phosphate acyltransferase
VRRPDSPGTGIWIRSLIFFVTMVVSIVPYSLVALIACVLPPRPRLKVIGTWAHLIIGLLRTLCRIDFHVEYEEGLPDGPAVVLSKHQSAWETIAFQLIFPPQSWVLKRELLWIPFFGWGLAAARPISIDRRAGVRALDELVKQGKQRLKEGLWVIVFPEGTRTAPGTRRRARRTGRA